MALSLWVKLGLKTGDFAKSMQKIEKDFNKLGSKLTSIGSKMTQGFTLPLIGIGAAAIKSADDIDSAMAAIRTGTGATGKQLAELETSFQTVFKDVPNSAADVATALAELNTRTGQTGAALETLATQMLNLSKVQKTDINQTVATSTRVFGDWSVAVEDQSKAMDYLFKVSQQTGPTVDRIGQLMVQYGAPLRQMGFGFEETAALMGKFEKEGVNTELVMSSMRQGLTKFAKAGVEPKIALQKVMEEIKNTASVADANVKAIEIFGARSGPDMAAAIREGRFSIEDLKKSIAGSTDTINKAAEDSRTFTEKLMTVGHDLNTAFKPLGDVLVKAIEGLLPAIKSISNWISSLSTKFANLPKGVQNLILGFAAFAAAIGPLIFLAGKFSLAISSIFGAIGLFSAGGVLAPIVASFAGLGTAIASIALPVTAVVAGLTILVLAIKKAWDTNEKFRNAILMWKDVIVNTFSNIGSRIAVEFNNMMDWLGNIFNAFKETFGGIIDLIAGVVANIVRSFTALSKIVSGIFSGDFRQVFSGFVDYFWAMLDGIVDFGKNLIKVFDKTIGLIAEIFFKGGKQAYENFKKWVFDGIENIVNWFIKQYNKIVKLFHGKEVTWKLKFDFDEPQLKQVKKTVTKSLENVAVKPIKTSAVPTAKTTTIGESFIDSLKKNKEKEKKAIIDAQKELERLQVEVMQEGYQKRIAVENQRYKEATTAKGVTDKMLEQLEIQHTQNLTKIEEERNNTLASLYSKYAEDTYATRKAAMEKELGLLKKQITAEKGSLKEFEKIAAKRKAAFELTEKNLAFDEIKQGFVSLEDTIGKFSEKASDKIKSFADTFSQIGDFAINIKSKVADIASSFKSIGGVKNLNLSNASNLFSSVASAIPVIGGAVTAFQAIGNILIKISGSQERAAKKMASYQKDVTSARATIAALGTESKVVSAQLYSLFSQEDISRVFQYKAKVASARDEVEAAARAFLGFSEAQLEGFRKWAVATGKSAGKYDQWIYEITRILKTGVSDVYDNFDLIDAAIKGMIGSATALKAELIELFGLDPTALASNMASAFDAVDLTEFKANIYDNVNDVIKKAVINGFLAGDVLKPIFSELSETIYGAMSEGIVTAAELADINAVVAKIEGPMVTMFETLDALGLGVKETVEEIGETAIDTVKDTAVYLSGVFDAADFTTLGQNLEKTVLGSVRNGLIKASLESEAIKPLLDTLNATIAGALEFGGISDVEMGNIRTAYENLLDPLKTIFDRLGELGLGFESLNGTTEALNSSLQEQANILNAPTGFNIGKYRAAATMPGNAPMSGQFSINGNNFTIVANNPMEMFEQLQKLQTSANITKNGTPITTGSPYATS